MARRAAFLYRIDTDENPKKLLSKITFFSMAHKIDFNADRPWRGFMPDGSTGDIIRGLDRGIFYAAYGFERVKKVERFDGKTEILYLPYPVSVIIDPKRKILALQTSDKMLAEDIFGLLQHEIEDANYIRLVPAEFEDRFLRWLVNNAVKGGGGVFARMSGVKLGRLRDFDNELNDAILMGDDQIGRSRIYNEMRNNVHRYLVGYANVGSRQYRVRVYDHGQITLSVGEPLGLAPIIPVIAEEIFSLQDQFSSP